MKKLFLFLSFALLNIYTSSGQGVNSQTAKGNDVTDASVISGHFDIERYNKSGVAEHINVNYSISSLPLTKVLHLALNTAESTDFSADIINEAGVVALHWSPKNRSYNYMEALDISKLAPGKYKLNLYSTIAEGILKSIAFTKETEKN